MISMHCPSCGAEGRVPEGKIDTRLVCKKCFKSFHITPEGHAHAGPPPQHHAQLEEELGHGHGHGHHANNHDEYVDHNHVTPGHEFDHVDEEIDLVMQKIRETLPKVGIALGVLIAGYLIWPYLKWSAPVGLNDQTTAAALALAHGDPSALRRLAVDPSAATELSEAVRSEFQGRDDIVHSSSPTVEVYRSPGEPGPGLAEVTASIRPNTSEQRTGLAVRDTSTDLKLPSPVQIPLVLTGDDGSGWWLDAARSLEAYRKSKTPPEPPPATADKPETAKAGKRGATARRPSASSNAPAATTGRLARAPRA